MLRLKCNITLWTLCLCLRVYVLDVLGAWIVFIVNFYRMNHLSYTYKHLQQMHRSHILIPIYHHQNGRKREKWHSKHLVAFPPALRFAGPRRRIVPFLIWGSQPSSARLRFRSKIRFRPLRGRNKTDSAKACIPEVPMRHHLISCN